jgi:hypothetical protein
MAATEVHRQISRFGGVWRRAAQARGAGPPRWAIPAAVCGVTLLGFLLRIAELNQGLFGDELSTGWIVHGRSLDRVISLVYSDAEVTPPLSFVLAWISLKIGSSWEWMRVPSLLGGTATIPIVYALGARVASRKAGLIAAAITAMSAVMIMFSTEARNYAVMMAAVAGSTLAMLVALDTRKARWWVIYAAASVLIAQLVWLLWSHPEARRPALLANVGAAIAYAPWIPGWIKDTHSVTVPIINAVLPFSPSFVARSTAEWAFGYPYLGIRQAPGLTVAFAICVGLVLALFGAVVRHRRALAGFSGRIRAVFGERIFLIAFVASATLLGEVIYSAVGTHVLDSRDLNASWPALAVLIGVVIAAAGPVLGSLSCVLVLVGYGASAADTLKTRWQRPNYPAAARFITSHARPGDVVIDASIVPVVPLTALDAFLPQDRPEFRLGLDEGPPPYTLASKVPPGSRLIRDAVHAASDRRIFLLSGSIIGQSSLTAVIQKLQAESGATKVLAQLPRGYRIETTQVFPGIETLVVSVVDLPHRRSGSG